MSNEENSQHIDNLAQIIGNSPVQNRVAVAHASAQIARLITKAEGREGHPNFVHAFETAIKGFPPETVQAAQNAIEPFARKNAERTGQQFTGFSVSR